MKKKIKSLIALLDDKLRQMCGEITPEKRIIWIISLLLLFAVINLYITFHAVYNMGQNSQPDTIRIEHIRMPEVLIPQENN